MNRREFLLATAGGLLVTQTRLLGQSTAPMSEFLTDVPDYPGNVLLARPTDRSITLNICIAIDSVARVHFGQNGAQLSQKSAEIRLRANEPLEVVLDGLQPSTAYDYELRDTRDGQPLLPTGVRTFRTARLAGESFTFTVQADSHLDDGCRTDIYKQTLENQIVDQPDFMIDLGDTSMAGKHPNRDSAMKQYLAQRYYFGLLGHSVPSFLVVGNHDGEEAKLRGATQVNGIAVWSNQQRKRYFSNPVPDKFYTGNNQLHPHAGLLQNFYAWAWGDALFVVLDPYWTSTASRGESAGWKMSLGRAQYDWLAETLKRSRARHKIVLIHQLVGGLDNAGRGGAEAAGLFEWGGCDIDRRNTFAEHRPGWPMPIHQLLTQSGVGLVIHGHDHFFADQNKDGIEYLLAPQAAHRNYRNDHSAEYGYQGGRFMPNSGHLRFSITPSDMKIDYVRSVPSTMARQSLRNRDISSTVMVKASRV